MKKVTSLILVVLLISLILAVLPGTVGLAASTDEFVIENGVLIKYNGPGGNIVIPDGVRQIGSAGGGTGVSLTIFTDRESITGLTFPDSLEVIGEPFIFSGAVNLKSVTFPEKLTSIGWGAFANCTGLESIVIP